MISAIKIRNIKGFGEDDNVLNVNLNHKKINLLIAPNGFGKSSLAVAISSLNKRNRIDVNEDHFHKNRNDLAKSVEINLDGDNLVADETSNEILPKIQPYVINSRLKVKTSSQRFNNHTLTRGHIAIEEIVLRSSIPPKVGIDYKISQMRHAFGANGKILTNFENIFTDNKSLRIIYDCLPLFYKFSAKKRDATIQLVLNRFNAKNGSANEIVADIQDADLIELEADPEYLAIQSELKRIPLINGSNKYELFQLFFQILKTYLADKERFRKACERAVYELEKEQIDREIQSLNSTWHDLHCKEEDGVLKVKFPKAKDISNGQRDILTFVLQLVDFKSKITSRRANLLVVDEVFDYLDDANIIAAQFYLSSLFKQYEKTDIRIFIVLLTHLSPRFFRSYVFNDKLLNVVYLKPSLAVPSANMKAFVVFRQNLNKNAQERNLQNDISAFFFHYNPNSIDLTNQIPRVQNLKSDWFKGNNLKTYIAAELSKYVIGDADFDPYAVSLGIRLRIEKIAYDQLTTDEQKQTFINIHLSKEKLAYAESMGVDVSQVWGLLGVIYNDSEHLPDVSKDKACVYKLENHEIWSIICNLFDHANPVPVDMIS